MITPMDTKKCVIGVDWHPADVKAALEKRGVSLRALAREHGYSHIQRVLTSPWWAVEQLVAQAIGVPAQEIWPTRYQLPRHRGQRMTRNEVALVAASKSTKPTTKQAKGRRGA